MNASAPIAPAAQLTARQGALEMARRGFRVFPLLPNSKAPFQWDSDDPAKRNCSAKDRRLMAGSSKIATTDPAKINRWFDHKLDPEFPYAGQQINYGVRADDMAIIDVDKKGGKRGFENLFELQPIPDSLTIRTVTGGQHIYLQAGASNLSQRPIRDGLDVRNGVGYVVGPYSVIDGDFYYILRDKPVERIPDHVLAEIKAAPERHANASVLIGDLDTPVAVAMTRAFLERTDGAKLGSRNNTAFWLAAQIKDWGLSVDTIVELLENVWSPKCEEPLSEDELRQVAVSAYSSGKYAPGERNPAVDFEGVFETLAKIIWAPFSRNAEYLLDKPKTPQKFVVDRWIPEQFVSAFSGDAGIGKTSTLMHMGVCVAAGKPFFGFDVRQGEVLAIMAENTEEQIGAFIEASCEHIGADPRQVARKLFVESTINKSSCLWSETLSGDELKEHIAWLGRRLADALDKKPNVKFVLLDSQIDVYEGSTIDNQAVARFLVWLTRLAKEHDIGIALICHESKASGDNDSHAISGGMAWRYKPKSIGRFERGAFDGQAILKHTKHSFSPAAQTLTLEFQGGIFVAVNNDVERQSACCDTTLEILKRANEDGENMSLKPKANNYAPRFMARNQGSDGDVFSVEEFEQAIKALLTVQKIGIQKYQNKGKKCERYIILEDDGE